METTADGEEMEDSKCESCGAKKKDVAKSKRKEIGLSCMLNTEVGAVLAMIRRPEFISPQDPNFDTSIQQSLKSLRALIFNPQQEWRTIDPSIYISPFLDVIQSDEIPPAATGVALAALLKILKLGIFDEKTPGAKDAMNSIVSGITCCRLEKTDPASEDAVMMKILQVLSATMKHPASIWLTDQTVCTIVNTCFQVVQQSASRGDLLQRNARYAMHDLIQTIFSKLPDFEVYNNGDNSDSDTEDADIGSNSDTGYGVRCAVDIFHFLCSLLNVVEVHIETEGITSQSVDEDVQLFSLVLINSAIELGGDAIGKHPKLLRMIQDDLFHHLIHYGACSSPLVLSMICSTVLNIYHFLRRFIRLQLEAFFSFVLLRNTSHGSSVQLQEVALDGIINFCRQPTFVIEAYVNYDCDPTCRSLFEKIGKLLCKNSFPSSGPFTPIQIQAFEGLVIMIHNIADNIDKENDTTPSKPYPVEITDYRPFWVEKPKKDTEEWVEFLRVRRAQKRKILVAANHFNRDDKKGLDYLKLNKLISDPPDPKAYAFFFRFTPGLDKTTIGDYLGDPDEFHIEVLKEFAQTFEFTAMVLDSALRTFLETFQLPGESQKIERILDKFSEKFYNQQPSELFVSKDTVFILCYSIIMLNTDQHSTHVKRKMTEDEFIRNNRAINGGKDLPREYLSELFHSISAHAIKFHGQSDMAPSRWIELMNRSKLMQPFILCDYDRRLGRDMFACIAGPSVATLTAFFEHVEQEDEILHECLEGLISVARIAQYGLEDTLDELIASFCKFTTLLNPYVTPEETLFVFSNDMKPKMATLAVFTIANNFGESIRGGWRNIVDCLLKLRRLKLLPQSVIEFELAAAASVDGQVHSRSESGVLFPGLEQKSGKNQNSGIINRFSHFLSLDSMEENVSLGLNEFEQNLKIIKQCRIGHIFANSSSLPDDSLLNLGRSLIFAAGGKGQKFSTPVEEEETVGFCWDVVVVISLANIHRFHTFWPSFHDYLLRVAHFPMFSPVPFAEKAIIGLFKVCLKVLASYQADNVPEDLIFKSINLMWKLDKEILDTCCDPITQSVSKIIIEYPANLQTQLGWKSVLHLLSVCGRHPETYDQAVETLIMLMSDANHVLRMNYSYCIDCAFGFVALKNSPLEKNLKILDLMADSVNLLIQWYKNACSDQGMNYSIASNASSSSIDEYLKGTSFAANLFIKLGEALRKTSLARREEIRNEAVFALQKSFTLAEGLDFTSTNCINSFNLVIFAMVDDLHEKMLEYSKRENAENEMRSREATLKIAMELMTDVYLDYLKPIAESSSFRTFWLGILRRMDTCMKADLGPYGETALQEVIPVLLNRMITKMKEEEILKANEDDDLWEITYIQIQWIAPALKEELFPDEV